MLYLMWCCKGKWCHVRHKSRVLNNGISATGCPRAISGLGICITMVDVLQNKFHTLLHCWFKWMSLLIHGLFKGFWSNLHYMVSTYTYHATVSLDHCDINTLHMCTRKKKGNLLLFFHNSSAISTFAVWTRFSQSRCQQITLSGICIKGNRYVCVWLWAVTALGKCIHMLPCGFLCINSWFFSIVDQ